MSQSKEPFLERWSRLKQEGAGEKPSAAEEKKKEVPATPLPPVEELKPDSDFKPFMDPRVDLETRRAALKKLFGDAHFNAPDAFEPYSADFTANEPIPLEMLKKLNQARRLVFDEAEPAKEEVKEEIREMRQEAKDVPGKQDA